MSSSSRNVIVTGASAGIGAAIAKAFLARGDRVALVARSTDRLTAVADGSPNAFVITQDLTVKGGPEAAIKASVEALGGLDILVNNAGATKLGQSLEETTEDDFDWHMNLHVKSVFLLTKHAAPHLEKTKGNVLNISSVVSRKPFLGFVPYNVAKGAVDVLTKSLAIELASKGVRVNQISPAAVQSEFFKAAGLPDEAAEGMLTQLLAKHPIGRLGVPADIANMVDYLTDNEKASWITGADFKVDGGFTLL